MLRILCDAIIPLLVGLLLYAGSRERPLRAFARVAASLGWVYALHFADRGFNFWGSADLDFSTHSAVAIAVGTTLAMQGLAMQERGWVAATLVVWLCYAGLMVHLGYHTAADIGTTALAAFPGVAACQSIGRRDPQNGTVAP